MVLISGRSDTNLHDFFPPTSGNHPRGEREATSEGDIFSQILLSLRRRAPSNNYRLIFLYFVFKQIPALLYYSSKGFQIDKKIFIILFSSSAVGLCNRVKIQQYRVYNFDHV